MRRAQRGAGGLVLQAAPAGGRSAARAPRAHTEAPAPAAIPPAGPTCARCQWRTRLWLDNGRQLPEKGQSE